MNLLVALVAFFDPDGRFYITVGPAGYVMYASLNKHDRGLIVDVEE